VGDEVTAKVLKFDSEKNRVSLGLKQLGEDPWVGIGRRLPPGDPVVRKSDQSDRTTGRVRRGGVGHRGPGARVGDGLDHTRTCIRRRWCRSATRSRVMILEIDEERRRISLGMKQCMPNPWEDFAREYKKGDKVKGQIKSITDFGVFVGLPGGIDGLVHLSDLSWSTRGRGGGEELQERRGSRGGGAVDRRRARAHLARPVKAARGRSRSPTSSPATRRTAW